MREEPDDQSGGFMASALLFLNLTAADRAGGNSKNDSKAVDKGSMWVLSNSGKQNEDGFAKRQSPDLLIDY